MRRRIATVLHRLAGWLTRVATRVEFMPDLNARPIEEEIAELRELMDAAGPEQDSFQMRVTITSVEKAEPEPVDPDEFYL